MFIMKQIYFICSDILNKNSFSSKIFEKLTERTKDCKFARVRDSFELVRVLNTKEDFVLVDSLEDLPMVKEVPLELLKKSSILSSENLDSNFILNFISPEKKIRFIGIPKWGDIGAVLEDLEKIILDFQ